MILKTFMQIGSVEGGCVYVFGVTAHSKERPTMISIKILDSGKYEITLNSRNHMQFGPCFNALCDILADDNLTLERFHSVMERRGFICHAFPENLTYEIESKEEELGKLRSSIYER